MNNEIVKEGTPAQFFKEATNKRIFAQLKGASGSKPVFVKVTKSDLKETLKTANTVRYSLYDAFPDCIHLNIVFSL